jgi:hypothetical protein
MLHKGLSNDTTALEARGHLSTLKCITALANNLFAGF